MKKSILIYGTLPPPIGGVRIFNKHLYDYLIGQGYQVSVFPRIQIRRYEASVISYSLPWKRFVAILISKVLFKKIFIIIHSSKFDFGNYFNRWSSIHCDGIITTSQIIKNHMSAERITTTTLVQSGLLYKEFFCLKNSSKKQKIFKKNSSCKYILFYQYSNGEHNGRSIYGADLMTDSLQYLPESIGVIWIDLSGENKHSTLKKRHKNLTYINKPVNIQELLVDIDLLVRPTSFDGTAFMVIEAIESNVKVLCSNVVLRPSNVDLFSYDDIITGNGFAKKIIKSLNSTSPHNDAMSGNLPSIKSFINFIVEP